MTREEWAERLPLIQAFVEGKTIETDIGIDGTDWYSSSTDLEFKGPISKYRIKPEPKVIWVNEYPHFDNKFEAYSDREMAIKAAYVGVESIAVKYVEVVE